MTNELSELLVSSSDALRAAMRTIDRAGYGIAFVVDDEELVGVATDGDIRRAILDGTRLDAPVSKAMNDDPVYVYRSEGVESVRGRMQGTDPADTIPKSGRLIVPVLDDREHVVSVSYLSADDGSLSLTEAPIDGGERTNGTVGTVTVIGGAGYIGSVLCRALLDQGYSVRVLDNLVYGDHGVRGLLEHDRFEFIEGDMRSIEAVLEAVKPAQAVVHLGALVGDPASGIDSQKTLELNYHSVKLVAEICRYHQINRFLFASTCSVYGRSKSEDELLAETDPLNPVSLYAQTKIESERALLEMADDNFAPTILRMATIYGLSPRMRFDLVGNILPAKAYTENVVPIFGGSQYRPNVHVRDAARAYIDCIEAPIRKVAGEIFNVGSNAQNYQIIEIGEIVADCFPEAEIDRQREKEDERSYQVDFSKIRDVLDYEVEHTIRGSTLEIKEAFEAGRFDDYTDDRYNNYRTLENNMEMLATVERPSSD